jgi:hypothetical protein
LLDARHKNNMMDVRNYMGANADSDHYLVITRIRAKIGRSKYIPKRENNKIQCKQPKTDRGQERT